MDNKHYNIANGKIIIKDRTKPRKIINPYWIYINNAVHPNYFNLVYNEIDKKCHTYKVKMYNRVFDSKRRSCVLISEKVVNKLAKGGSTFQYSDVPNCEWNCSPSICKIKHYVESLTSLTFDFCLVNIYKNGDDYIGYHSDKNADKSCVLSISLGCPRKFRFRKKEDTSGFDYEFTMESGDLLIMLGPTKDNNYIGCQSIYKHSVPIEKKKSEPRINLTFRQFQS